MRFADKNITLFILVVSLIVIRIESSRGQTSKFISEFEYNEINTDYLNPDNIQQLPYVNINNLFLYNNSLKLLKGSLNWNLRFGLNNQFIHTETNERDQVKHKPDFTPLELFYQKSVGNFTFAIGRKRIKWGVSYVASPTDIVSSPPPPEDPSDRLFQIKGSDLLEITYVGKRAQYDIYLMPATNVNTVFFSDHSAAFRYYRNIQLFDVSLVGRIDLQGAFQTGLNATASLGSKLEAHMDGIVISKSDVRYPPLFERKNTPAYRLLAGINYSPRDNYNIVVEYFHINEGYSSDEWDQFQEIINFYATQRLINDYSGATTSTMRTMYGSIIFPMRKNFIFLRLFRSNFFTSKFDLEWITFGGLDDLGSLNRIGTYYKFRSRFDLYIHYQFLANSSNSNFNMFGFAQSARIGIKVSF